MKTLSKFTLAFLLIVAPLFGTMLSSCTTNDGTDPLMKTTRLNEAPAAPSKKDAQQKEKPKVQSFQTNYAITI